MIQKTHMSQEEAVKFAATKWWVGKTAQEILDVQLFEDRLVMPFELYHEAVEEVLDRPVQTIELAGTGLTFLQYEYITKMLNAPHDDMRMGYTSAEDLLNDPEIDAVYIASPVFLHAQQAMAAADAGKHILIEKPLAMTAAEGQKVVEHCKEKGVLIAAGFMMRFGACIQAMKKAIAEGKIGKPVSAYAQFTCWYPDIPGAWRQKKTQGGGGALVDMGVHCIDLLQYVLGSKTAEVAAMHGTQTFNYEVDDSSTVLMRMQNGCQCVVQSNFNIPDNAAKWRLEVFGERGRLLGDSVIGQVDGGTIDAIFLTEQGGYDAQQDHAGAERTELHTEFGDMYAREIESFSNSILTGSPLEVPASDAVQVQRVIELAYRSNDEKKLFDL